jgi:predicted nucleotidyltransferase
MMDIGTYQKERTMVAEIIERNQNEITALCRKHQVRALWVFGSATTDGWDPELSDLDFLVDLGTYDSPAISISSLTPPMISKMWLVVRSISSRFEGLPEILGWNAAYTSTE